MVLLKASGRRGVVRRGDFNGGEWEHEIFFGGGATEIYPERFLATDPDDDSILGRIKNWTFLDASEFRQALTTQKLRRPLEHNLYSYLASRTDLQPYQFKPVLKLLASPYGRMFIADEVGLGKTIEAGIIMLELAARTSLRRVLVVCPPALAQKWRSELLERFDQEFEVLDGRRAREAFGDSESAAPIKAIGSLALLRQANLMETLAESESRFDLVVVDESHHMQNPLTMSHRLGEQLSGAADHMLMLSATPLSLSTDNLFHQLAILVPEEFFDVAEFTDRIAPNRLLNEAIRALRARPPRADAAEAALRKIQTLRQAHLFRGNPSYEQALELVQTVNAQTDSETRFQLQQRINELNTIGHVFTRTRKREVQDHFPTRSAMVMKVRLSSSELAFYDSVTEWVRQQSGSYANFATIMPQRQVASCIPAAREYFAERWGHAVLLEDDAAAELAFESDFESDEPGSVPQFPDGAGDLVRESWSTVEGVDSKYDAFRDALIEVITAGTARGGKVLVFSFFRKTLEYLARRLGGLEIDGAPLHVDILYGPTPDEDRHRIAAEFRSEPGPRVVLASEIAAEGLDFEFVNVMVNYDLPWNPMRVEQRIGRLDRYGQKAEKIHIVNFSVEETIEERILERLYDRIGIFKEAIGDLESILGDEIEKLTKELLSANLTPAEQEAVISQRADNIVRRQEENKRFEQESKALLGQDDVFTEQLHRLRRDERFVGPEEIENFVTVAGREKFPRMRMVKKDGLLAITPPTDGSLGQLLSEHLTRIETEGKTTRARRPWQAVERARPGREWLVTFDPETAKSRRELDFVTLQHPLVGALLHDQPDVLRPTAALFHPPVDGHAGGEFAFFIYLLNIHSFRRGLEFLPVAVRLGADVDDLVSQSLLRLVRSATDDPGSRPGDAPVDLAAKVADRWVADQIRQRVSELRQFSDQILDWRATSLTESHERWLIHRQELLRNAERQHQQSIARLHRGYIRRRQGELAGKLRQIEEARGVEIGRELVAGGLLTVGAH